MLKEPLYKYVPTFRNYEDYHDAEQYTKGWNDAIDTLLSGAGDTDMKYEDIKNLLKNFLMKCIEDDKIEVNFIFSRL